MYCDANDLNANMTNTKVLVFSRLKIRFRKLITFKFGKISLEQIDDNVYALTFSKHIAKIAAKANSRLGLIKRTFKIRTEKIILVLYTSLVRPILEYSSVIWSPRQRCT